MAGSIRMLNIIDEFTRECLAIRVDRKLNSTDVIDVLSDLFILRGVPGHIRSDNGPEFIAKAVREWIAAVGAKTAYIEPGSPWENGYCESFNSKLRDELLNGEIFYSARGGQGHHRELAAPLQHRPTALIARLQTAGARGLHARAPGCATPTSSAGRALAGAKTNPKLTCATGPLDLGQSNEVVHLGLERRVLEVLDPAVRRDQRKVGTEQHLVLELAVGVAHQLFGKVLRRPAGQIDVDVGLVQANRQRFRLPRPGRVRDDDRHVRKIDRDIVDVNRIGVLQPQAATARHVGADAGMTAVENGRQLVLGDHLVKLIGHAVIRKKSLHGRMELEALDDAGLDQIARFAHAHAALVRIDRSRTPS